MRSSASRVFVSTACCVVVRSSLVMAGYYKDTAATAEASRHGWHHTGDIGYLDDDDFLYIVDRAKDMIISGGFNVYSVEVEQALMQHPDVQDSAVVGLPDEKWGERVVAVLQLHAGRGVDPVADLQPRQPGLSAGALGQRHPLVQHRDPILPALGGGVADVHVALVVHHVAGDDQADRRNVQRRRMRTVGAALLVAREPRLREAGGRRLGDAREAQRLRVDDQRADGGEVRLEDNHPGLKTIIALPRAGPAVATA